MTKIAKIIHIRGLVQGVGFRPFVYRMAVENQLNGWVENNNEGVKIAVEGSEEQINHFISALETKLPVAANIQTIFTEDTQYEGFTKFVIKQSSSTSDVITEVSPDIAVCDDCLNDMKTQAHRIDYPFINCTNCGPRFTIVKDLPYDRHLTTMLPFEMCPVCRHEYESILDRRFHAQPVACTNCGPTYSIYHTDGKQIISQNTAEIIAKYIDEGQIIALKGLGGYHLICDATNEKSVKLLRLRKNREGKPMAVMVASIEAIKSRFHINYEEEKALKSWQRPIVLLKNKNGFAHAVSNGMHTTGIVLPYMPIHYQLFDYLKTEAIVLTSGNRSDEPITISDEQAKLELSKVADLIVSYNREIHNRTDDSVVFIASGKERLLRRSRGFVPSSIQLMQSTEGIFAAGAELVNTFGIGKGNTIILSQHIGDLKNAETFDFFEESYNRFSNLFRFKPSLIACDMHPDYLSSQFARELGAEVIEIQHHHAHIASCMAEHGLDENVIGIALDGTGFGDDGTIWGGEFFVCDLENYNRVYYFDPLPLPGGDKATQEPWRSAVSYLYKYFGKEIFESDLPFLAHISKDDLSVILQAIDLGINCPLSSGAGRLFDAIAAMTGICTTSSFHAEAPMRLEAIAQSGCNGKYLFDIEGERIVFLKLFYMLLKDLKKGVPVSEISAKFHNTMIVVILHFARKIREQFGLNKVVLSGGTFQNKYLLEKSEQMLQNAGFEVYTHQKVPSNDGGIALGQMAIAAKKRQKTMLKN